LELANKIILIAIKADSSAEATNEEYPALLQDLRDAFNEKKAPFYLKGATTPLIDFKQINEKRISLEELAEDLEYDSKNGKVAILISCSENHAAEAREIVKAHNAKQGFTKVKVAWATAGDVYRSNRDPDSSDDARIAALQVRLEEMGQEVKQGQSEIAELKKERQEMQSRLALQESAKSSSGGGYVQAADCAVKMAPIPKSNLAFDRTLKGSNISVSDDGTQATHAIPSDQKLGGIFGTQGFSTGRHQWSVAFESGESLAFGVALREKVDVETHFNKADVNSSWTWMFYVKLGKVFHNKKSTEATPPISAGAVLHFELDMDVGELRLTHDDTKLAKPLFTGLSGQTLFPYFELRDVSSIRLIA